MSYIIYDHSDFLQAPQNIVLCCPASLESNSAARRYGFAQLEPKTFSVCAVKLEQFYLCLLGLLMVTLKPYTSSLLDPPQDVL